MKLMKQNKKGKMGEDSVDIYYLRTQRQKVH